KSSTLPEVRAWLKHIGGVHIYQDGLRVPPYGGPGNDWLDLNLARVRSPELRPGTNTSIGRVTVTNVSGALIQKTDRDLFRSQELDPPRGSRLAEAHRRGAHLSGRPAGPALWRPRERLARPEPGART